MDNRNLLYMGAAAAAGLAGVGAAWFKYEPQKLTAGQTTTVQHISGTDVSRLKGHKNMVFVYLLLASLVGIGVVTLRFWKFYKS